tara:strand:- start:7 stop:459 length:453 start_codon:yes stop_codon:yes gene_type:complete
MNIKRVKQGAKLTLFNGIYMILLGAFLIAFVRYNMKSNFQAISSIWRIFVKYNPKIAQLFFLFNASIGILLISTGIIIIYLSYFIIKRKDKMAWIVLFLSGITSWAGLLVISILIRNWVIIAVIFIGWASFAIGMLLPIRYYVQKNYREY